jgi:hypothetical protein
MFSIEMLQLEASMLAQTFNIPVTEFKASYKWVLVTEPLAALNL